MARRQPTRFGESYDYLFKIVVVGNSGVGKSALLNRYVDDTFSESHLATVGVDFKIKTKIFTDPVSGKQKTVKLTIWDTAGQERFASVTNRYYRGADGVFLVYDISDGASFEKIDMWLNEIHSNTDSQDSDFTSSGNSAHFGLTSQKATSSRVNSNGYHMTQNSFKTSPKLSKILIGNKSDLNNKRAVTRQHAETYAIDHQMEFYETSAKNNDKVEFSFEQLIKQMIEASDLAKEMTDTKLKNAAKNENIDLNNGIEINISSEMKQGCC